MNKKIEKHIKKAGTLFEVMVSITVIAIITAAFIPALTQDEDPTDQNKCAVISPDCIVCNDQEIQKALKHEEGTKAPECITCKNTYNNVRVKAEGDVSTKMHQEDIVDCDTSKENCFIDPTDSCKVHACIHYIDHCEKCTKDTCKKCDHGYLLNRDGKSCDCPENCSIDPDTGECKCTTPPSDDRRTETGCMPGFREVNIVVKKDRKYITKTYCVTRRNIGDDDYLAINSANIGNYVTFNKTKSKCITTKEGKQKCCWHNNTATSTAAPKISQIYETKNRTVCTWWAGKTLCDELGKQIGMEGKVTMPPIDILEKLLSQEKSYNKLAFCDDKSGSYLCTRRQSAEYCAGMQNNQGCRPAFVWSSTSGKGSNYLAYGATLYEGRVKGKDAGYVNGNYHHGQQKQAHAQSVRCMYELK